MVVVVVMVVVLIVVVCYQLHPVLGLCRTKTREIQELDQSKRGRAQL